MNPNEPGFLTEMAKTAAQFAKLDEMDRGGYRISASNLGVALGPQHSSCPLAFWLLMHGADRKPRKPGMFIMTEAGNNMENTVIRMLQATLRGSEWRVKATQLPVEFEVDGKKYKSTLDILLHNTVTEETMVIDIKTSRGRAFSYRKEAKPDHVLQVQAYMMAVDADKGGIWYVDREGQNFMDIFEVKRADSRVKKAVMRLENIAEDVKPAGVGYTAVRKENKGPDALYVNRHWHVGYCDVVECPCAKAYPEPPKAKLASVTKEGDGTAEITLTDLGSKWWSKVGVAVRDLFDKVDLVIIDPKDKE